MPWRPQATKLLHRQQLGLRIRRWYRECARTPRCCCFPTPDNTIGAAFHAGNSIAVDVQADGQLEGVVASVAAPGSSGANSIVPRLLRDTAGNWRITAATPQVLTLSSRYAIDGIDGLDNAATGEVDADQRVTYGHRSRPQGVGHLPSGHSVVRRNDDVKRFRELCLFATAAQ